MRAVSEATRQIVEFEELVSRLDRINDHHRAVRTSASSSLLTRLSTSPSSSSVPQRGFSLSSAPGSIRHREGSFDTAGEAAGQSGNGGLTTTARSVNSATHVQPENDRLSYNNGSAVNDEQRLQADSHGSQTGRGQKTGSLYSGNSSGSSSFSSSYHPTEETTVNERGSSSFPAIGTGSAYYEPPASRSLQQRHEHPLISDNLREKRVRVNIGIDEDLRMILEMDPSIVDRQPPTPPPLPPRRPPPPPPPLPTQTAAMNSGNSTLAGIGGSRSTGSGCSPGHGENRTQASASSIGGSTNSSSSVFVGRPPRATRPQGWYWNRRD